MIDKINKITLPAAVLIASIIFSIILGGFYYAVQVNKQKSIERQHQKEYEAKKRKMCYEIYKGMAKMYNNVVDYRCEKEETIASLLSGKKDERDDVCIIMYKNPKWKKGDPLKDQFFTRRYKL